MRAPTRQPRHRTPSRTDQDVSFASPRSVNPPRSGYGNRPALFTDFWTKSPAKFQNLSAFCRVVGARAPAQGTAGLVEPVVLPDHLPGARVAPGKGSRDDQTAGLEQVGQRHDQLLLEQREVQETHVEAQQDHG